MFKRIALLSAAALAVVAVVTSPLAASPASAAAPPSAVAEFNAPSCEGLTDNDPTDASGAVSDLTRVFGQRLVDYNNGQIVVLYNNRGANAAGVAPLCGTRYVEGQGAVSEWMFCTDAEAHTCGETDEEGYLLDEGGNRIGGQERIASNPKLSSDQEKIIAYLIQNGHTYIENGNPLPDASRETSSTRLELQNLIWCVSDDPGWALCNANMNDAEQARILALIPDDPTVELTIAGNGANLQPGDTAEFELKTNLHEQPIEVSFSGIAGTPTVISGPATLEGTTLTVHGTDPAALSTIVLGFTSSATGRVTLDATASPASTTHLGWAQSPGVAEDGVPCQVFATFHEEQQTQVTATASADFAPIVVPVGSFQITKVVVNPADLAVPTVYGVDYECNDGTSGLLSLVPGTAQQVADLPVGTECDLTERTPAALSGGTWATPTWLPANVSSSSYQVTITDAAVASPLAITLTNTAVPTIEDPDIDDPGTDNPGTDAPTEPGEDAGSGAQESLAHTGGADATPVVAGAVILLTLGGVLLLAIRRRTQENA